MKGLKIRPADENDVPTLVALAEKFMPKMASARKRMSMLRWAMKSPDYELLVAELNGEIVGFIDRWDIYDLAEGAILSSVGNLYVAPWFRRRGVGANFFKRSWNVRKGRASAKFTCPLDSITNPPSISTKSTVL